MDQIERLFRGVVFYFLNLRLSPKVYRTVDFVIFIAVLYPYSTFWGSGSVANYELLCIIGAVIGGINMLRWTTEGQDDRAERYVFWLYTEAAILAVLPLAEAASLLLPNFLPFFSLWIGGTDLNQVLIDLAIGVPSATTIALAALWSKRVRRDWQAQTANNEI